MQTTSRPRCLAHAKPRMLRIRVFKDVTTRTYRPALHNDPEHPLVPKSRPNWPEIVFGGGTASSRISRAVDRGELRKIGPALYTSHLHDPPAQVVERHRWAIVAHYAPNAVVTHRTAFEGRPSQDGTIFMTGPTSKRVDIPGLRLRVQKGPGPLAGDQPFVSGLTIASEPRVSAVSSSPPSIGTITSARCGRSRDRTRRCRSS